MSHHFYRLIQCKEAAPASLDAFCAQGCHHCCDEGPCEELSRKRAQNVAYSCASEQPYLPLKSGVLDAFQLPVLLTVHRSRLEVPRACLQNLF